MNNKNEGLGPSTFTSLILSLSSTAWISLGKIADPITGKVKKDLEGAKYSIDTLIMLREKTKGNLTADEQKLINGVIADLQANYAETVFSTKEEAKLKEDKESNKNEDNKEDEERVKSTGERESLKEEKNQESNKVQKEKKDTRVSKSEDIKDE